MSSSEKDSESEKLTVDDLPVTFQAKYMDASVSVIQNFRILPHGLVYVNNSEAALRAINKAEINSKLVEDCSKALKLLGMRPAKGLWGIRHTRKPVDEMVQAARTISSETVLPILKITVSTKGISLDFLPTNKTEKPKTVYHSIDTISYGVQDMVYTRVFCMIIVKDATVKSETPFECHAFVCDSRNTVRKLTYALAAAFQEYTKTVQKEEEFKKNKKFAIDLRSPEEMNAEADETEA